MKQTELSELERQRILSAFEDVHFAKLLGIEVVEIKRGSAKARLKVREDLKQNNAVVHGGAIASLIDTAAAFAIMTMLEPDQKTTTIDLTIHYLRPLTEAYATAQARVLRAGRRIIVASVEITDEAENLAATALTTYIRIT